jgi:hypothetical protein
MPLVYIGITTQCRSTRLPHTTSRYRGRGENMGREIAVRRSGASPQTRFIGSEVGIEEYFFKEFDRNSLYSNFIETACSSDS